MKTSFDSIVTILGSAWLALSGGCGGVSRDALVSDGLTKLRHGEYSAAAQLLTRAVDRDPDDATALCNLGIAQWKIGESDGAARSLQRAAALASDDPRPLEFLAHVYIGASDLTNARSAADGALERCPHSPRLLTLKAHVEYLLGNPDTSLRLLQYALHVAPDYAPALYNTAVVWREPPPRGKGNREAAAQYFRAYLNAARRAISAPYSGIVPDPRHMEAARVFLEPPRKPAARSAGSAAQARAAPVPDLAAAEEAVRQGNYDSALVLLTRAVKADPGNPDALWELAIVYDKHLGMTEKAAECYAAFMRSFSGDARCALIRSEQASRAKTARPGASGAGGAEAQRAALEAWADGLEQHRAGNIDTAIARYREALRIDGRCLNAAYNLGVACFARRDFVGARDAFEHTLSLNPSMSDAAYMLGATYRCLNDNHKAVQYLNRALALNPNHAAACYALGLVYKESSPRLARACLERYLELEPAGSYASAAREILSTLAR